MDGRVCDPASVTPSLGIRGTGSILVRGQPREACGRLNENRRVGLFVGTGSEIVRLIRPSRVQQRPTSGHRKVPDDRRSWEGFDHRLTRRRPNEVGVFHTRCGVRVSVLPRLRGDTVQIDIRIGLGFGVNRDQSPGDLTLPCLPAMSSNRYWPPLIVGSWRAMCSRRHPFEPFGHRPGARLSAGRHGLPE